MTCISSNQIYIHKKKHKTVFIPPVFFLVMLSWNDANPVQTSPISTLTEDDNFVMPYPGDKLMHFQVVQCDIL